MADAPPPYDKSGHDKPPIDAKNSASTCVTSTSRQGTIASTSRNTESIVATSKALALLHQNSSPNSGSVLGFLWNPRMLFGDSESTAAVLHDLHTVVQPYTVESVTDRVALLQICAQLCAQHNIDLAALLEGALIDDHSALYWAMTNGPWPLKPPFELVRAVISHCRPLLKPETVREARHACIALRSQEMFQFLQMIPEFGALSTEDRFALGVLVPPETVVVEEMEGTTQPFSVRFHIPHFQKRMMLGTRIKVEFIARGRLWSLEFFTAIDPPYAALQHGHWSASLCMRENSLMTPVTCGVVFLDARPSPASPAPYWRSLTGAKNQVMRVKDGKAPKTGKAYSILPWTIFEHDSVCIAGDGSVTGILGVKLVEEEASKDATKTIPKPEEGCVVC